jgi:hypothetical protein
MINPLSKGDIFSIFLIFSTEGDLSACKRTARRAVITCFKIGPSGFKLVPLGRSCRYLLTGNFSPTVASLHLSATLLVSARVALIIILNILLMLLFYCFFECLISCAVIIRL